MVTLAGIRSAGIDYNKVDGGEPETMATTTESSESAWTKETTIWPKNATDGMLPNYI